MYEIIDDNGVIHSSGNEDEMTFAFQVMTNPEEYSSSDVKQWEADWEGDLKLVHVIDTAR